MTMVYAASSYAQSEAPEDACVKAGYTFGFFNGVLTTSYDANVVQYRLIAIHGKKGPTGEEIKYEVFYNATNGIEDFVEVFAQRLEEQNGILEERFELFFEALTGDGPWWSNIIAAIPEAADILSEFSDWQQTQGLELLARGFAELSTADMYADHRALIDSAAIEGRKMLFVAHSQGNLFVNKAYSYAVSKTSAAAVKVVHIAPASRTLSGEYTLADKDIVINFALRLDGDVEWANAQIPGYLLRPAGLNGQKDFLGHGIQEIYINPALAISSRVKGQIDAALASLLPPPKQNENESIAFFTATLTWDGSGDADLHAFEPGGFHVYYAARAGASGYLDVDNTAGFGPEHYYATCDAATLRTGTYRISVANWGRADGRTATVLIESNKDGVLATKSLTLGGSTGSTPTHHFFDVIVSRDEETGIFSASVGP
ncbi:hypothetical protein [Oligoflexus tunisiensis]|uniref:hypothetical protein n=1 Tax=Oligoflexus tunisiensis TaxID=708132 RepID=UPI00114CAE22|nr:hypothetical protein [Oligoflexus tunisiensis]